MRHAAITLLLSSLIGQLSFAADPTAGAARPLELPTKGTVAGPKQPQAAVVGKETIHVAFAAGETIYLTTSANAGARFETPRLVAGVPGLMAGMRRGPRIVADEKSIVISAIGSKEGNLSAWRSIDGGTSWLGPVAVNDEPKSCREGLHGMALGPAGQVACVWLDLRSKKTELYCAVSADGGATFGENRLAYRSPDGFICECCHPSAAYDSAGRLFVMWRNQIAGNRDLYLASSTDDGRTFSPAKKLGAGTWKKDACPMDGGAVAVTGSGKVATIWRRDQELFSTSAGETKEQRVGPGEQPTIAAGAAGTYLAWVARRPGSLMVKSPGSAKAIERATGALDPVLAAGTTANSPVALVWETGKGKDSSIWFANLREPRAR